MTDTKRIISVSKKYIEINFALRFIRLAAIVTAALALSACGGGGTSSGGGSNPAPAAAPPPAPAPPPTTIAGQFATDCMANVQVRRNGTALVQNICAYPINVRQVDSRFPAPAPVTEIAPGALVAVRLGDDSLSIGFGACRAPSIPEGARPGFFTCTGVPAGSYGKQQLFEVRYF